MIEATVGVERRCPGCGEWYPKAEGACPMCGHPPARFNKWLRTAQLNAGLYTMAERSVRDDEAVRRH